MGDGPSRPSDVGDPPKDDVVAVIEAEWGLGIPNPELSDDRRMVGAG